MRCRRVRLGIAIDLQHPIDQVDDPVLGDPGPRVEASLVAAIELEARVGDFDHEHGSRGVPLAVVGAAAGHDGQINVDYSVIAASGFLGALPAVLLVLIFQKYMVQGLTAGSVKG